MIRIDTGYKSFDEYLSTLSKPARKNYKASQKINSDLVYEQAVFDKDTVHRFMQIWERQLVRGNPIQWAFPVEHVEDLYNQGKLKLFQARNKDIQAMHFIQEHDEYMECHPPMWDKAAMPERNLGTYMWFNLIRYGIENKLKPLELGGAPENPNSRYKLRYVPKNSSRDLN